MAMPDTIDISNTWVRVKYSGGEFWVERHYMQRPLIGGAYAVIRTHEWIAAQQGQFTITKGHVSE